MSHFSPSALSARGGRGDRVVQFSPSLAPAQSVAANFGDFAMDDFEHYSPAHITVNTNSVARPGSGSVGSDDDSGLSGEDALSIDEDSQSMMRRIHTSPSSLYQMNEAVHYQRLPNNKMFKGEAGPAPSQQWDTDGSAYGGGANYGGDVHSAYPTHYYQTHAVNSSASSLLTLSPSSSSSSLASVSAQQSQQQQAYAAAMLEQGMRRIKSSPIALSSMLVPAMPVHTAAMPAPLNVLAANAGAGTKRKSAGTDGVPGKVATQANAQRRLARKAEAARASRRKKKQYVTTLEEKVAKLNAKLEALQASTVNGTVTANSSNLFSGLSTVETMHREEQQSIKENLLSLLNEIKADRANGKGSAANGSPSPTSPVATNSLSPSNGASTVTNAESPSSTNADGSKYEDLKSLVESFIHNSHKRQATVDIYFNQLERAMMPSVPVKFALWGLSQADEFYTSDGLWQSVMGKEIGLSSQQLKSLLSNRETVIALLTELNTCLSSVAVMRATMKGHLDDRQRLLEELTNLLAPQQLADFCIWVQQNPMCMQMLETVWAKGGGVTAAATTATA